MEAISEVPAREVGRVVQDFIDDGAVEVVVERAPDGTFRVTRVS
ncbi:MAG TPA: hypothetical protein VM733_09240 [Thermoanaerobaculia bacterium]|nr:hypothetical protein [Thermoanaerobaculia bacterium]